ncbi:MAG: TrkA C-terminal domain-containing protein [Halolamina sp.]|uniref:TrkA C-terminal domain-containing protein n=1 Tax=Halolamina sp. TaxID=1940283 RepID=UPI002FC36F82
MSSFPVQVLLGVYLGLVTGIIPALVAWTLGFGFKYLTSVTIPGFGVVVLALAIAGVNGGLLALNDKAITGSADGIAILVAIVVVLMLSLYAHAKGDQMGAAMPKRLTLKQLADRTLSADVVERAGGRGQVKVTVAGEVADIEGYPPLPAGLRAKLHDWTVSLPADLPISELEQRTADKLQTEYDLAEVTVRMDERGRASVSAAPPSAGLSKRVPQGKRAISVSTLIPTGLASGDEVRLRTDTGSYEGTVLGVASPKTLAKPAGDAAADGGTDPEPPATTPATTAAGGRVRVGIAVNRQTAETLLGTVVTRLSVRSRGERKEFELLSLLRRSGRRFRRLTVRAGGALDGVGIGELGVREEYGVVVLAIRRGGSWQLVPGGGLIPEAGQELYVVGRPGDLDAFEEAVA